MALNKALNARENCDYPAHSLVQIPSKNNQWYVVVTKPVALRDGKKNIQVRRSTKTSDYKIARQLEHGIIAKIYAEWDAALDADKTDPFIDLLNTYWIPNETNQNLSAPDFIERWGKVEACVRVWFEIEKQVAENNPHHVGRGFKQRHVDEMFRYLDYNEALQFRSVVDVTANPYPQAMQDEQEAKLAIFDRKNYPEDYSEAHASEASTASSKPPKAITNHSGCPTILEYLPKYLADEHHWKNKNLKTKGEIETRIKLDATIIGDLPLDQIYQKHGKAIALHLDRLGKANATIKTYTNNLSGMLDHASVELDEYGNPPRPFLPNGSSLKGIKLEGYGTQKRSFLALTEDQMFRLFAQQMDTEHRLLIAMLATTGMRLDEAALLTWDQLKQDKHSIRYFDLSMGKIKNDRFSCRSVAIPDCLELPARETGSIFKATLEEVPLNKDGKASSKLSKLLNKAYIHPIRLNDKDDRKVLHSLRSNLTGYMLNLTPTPHSEHMDWITGHSMDGSKTESVRQTTYGEDPDVKTKYDIVNRTQHPWLKQ